MSKPKNQPIGLCACPHRACEEPADVYRFSERGDSEAHRRFAGKLYLNCAVHGRFGSDGRAAMQDYILENAELWDEKTKASHVTSAPVEAPAKQPSTPPVMTAKPVQEEPQIKRTWATVLDL
jgi:hypothetical protein